jgi:tight adherence protein B
VIVVFGGMLGAGVLLMAAPVLWPRSAKSSRPAAMDGIRTQLALAGFERVPIAAFAVIGILLGAAGAATAQLAVGIPAVTVIAGLATTALAPLVVRRRAVKRLRENRAVWPDVVDHLVAAVRSGLSLPDAVGSVAEHGPPAVRAAFAGFRADYRASGQAAPALDALKDRLADPVADRIIETIRMAREVGGNDLATVLRGLAAYLREDAAVRAEVEARQSWIRNAARIGIAAPWIVLVLLASRPEAAAAYDTPAGLVLILAGLAVTVIAYRAMVALGRLPLERRWFA